MLIYMGVNLEQCSVSVLGQHQCRPKIIISEQYFQDKEHFKWIATNLVFVTRMCDLLK